MRQVGQPLSVRLGSVAGRFRTPLAGGGTRRFLAAGSVRESRSPGAIEENDPELVRDPPLARTEAVLFLAREPLTSRKLAQFAGLADGTAARTLIRRLNGLYDLSGSAFRVEEVAGGYQLLTRPQFGGWLLRMFTSPRSCRLSAPALETLAVVAYRQPAPRADIEAIRGVDCGEILRQLMDRDLVRVVDRGDELGRPYRYGTTRRFLQVFGLKHLDDLPWADKLRGVVRRAAENTPDTPPCQSQG